MKEKKLTQRGLVFGIFFVLLAAMVVITVPENVSAAPNKWVDKSYGPGTTGWGTTHFATIQSAVTAATSGDHIYVYDGTYNEAISLSTSSKSNIIIEGESQEDTIIDGSGTGWHIVWITGGSDDITFNKFTIQNSDSSFAAIYLQGSVITSITGCTFSNINIYDNYDGIRLKYAGDSGTGNANTFENIDCNGVGDDSIRLAQSSKVNYFNNIEIYQSKDLGGEGAIKIVGSEFNTFEGITIEQNYDSSTSTYYNGFCVLTGSDSNIIENSHITNTKNGIYMDGSTTVCTGNTIQENVIYSNDENGIYLLDCDDNHIVYNNEHYNGDWGIYLEDCGINEISGNIINNNYHGIHLKNSGGLSVINYNSITENYIYLNDIGIYLWDNSNYNEITLNTIEDNTNYGLEITEPDPPTSLACTYNIIHHNNFIDNNGAEESWDPDYIQAYDGVEIPPEGLNKWDNGYEEPLDLDISGGNYWSDWGPVGSDEFTGPNQDESEPEGDGIVDSVYFVEGLWAPFPTEDRYPLKEQA